MSFEKETASRRGDRGGTNSRQVDWNTGRERPEDEPKLPRHSFASRCLYAHRPYTLAIAQIVSSQKLHF